MRAPIDRESVRRLLNFGPKRFSEWIKHGYLASERGDPDEVPFIGVWSLIGQYDDLTDDLAAIYAAFTPSAQTAFRRGLSRAVAEMDYNDDINLLAATRMIETGGKITTFELLPILTSSILAKDFLRSTQLGRTLWTTALNVALDLAAQTDESFRSLTRIVTLPSFPEEYAARALRALCVAAPERLVDHLNLLGAPFHKLLVRCSPSASLHYRMELFCTIAKIAPVDVLLSTVEDGEGLCDSLSWWRDMPTSRCENDRVNRLMSEQRDRLADFARRHPLLVLPDQQESATDDVELFSLANMERLSDGKSLSASANAHAIARVDCLPVSQAGLLAEALV